MKKLLGIVVLAFLFSGNAYAGINEPGSGKIHYIEDVKKMHKEYLEKAKKKKQHLIHYVSSTKYVWAGWALITKKIDEKAHKKSHKKCMKSAKKWGAGEDCFIYAIDDKIVWNFDGSEKSKAKLAEAKATYVAVLKEEDKKEGRFFEDQPDVNDDYQIHFNFIIAKDGEDTELDINGYLEQRMLAANEKMKKWTAKNKKSNGVGQNFKLDMRKDGKLDVTFIRMNLTKKQIDEPRYPDGVIDDYLINTGFVNNPKKVYANFAGFKTKHGDSHGGKGDFPFMVIYTPAANSYGEKEMDMVVIHELFHAQRASFWCGKRTYTGTHVKGSDVLGIDDDLSTVVDSKNDTYYRHDIEGCPDLAKSVYLTPTAKDAWDPFDVFCRKNSGSFTHKDLYKHFFGCVGDASDTTAKKSGKKLEFKLIN